MFDIAAYLLHPLHGLGYQFWSGIGSDFGEYTVAASVIGTAALTWKHINCEHPKCPRPGHRHPDHGRPVCRRHYSSTEADPRG
jgi:hypothetical protein